MMIIIKVTKSFLTESNIMARFFPRYSNGLILTLSFVFDFSN